MFAINKKAEIRQTINIKTFKFFELCSYTKLQIYIFKIL